MSALENHPTVNVVIDGDDIIYRDYVDINIVVGIPKVCSLDIMWCSMHMLILIGREKVFVIKLFPLQVLDI